jgi:hypothetical protein
VRQCGQNRDEIKPGTKARSKKREQHPAHLFRASLYLLYNTRSGRDFKKPNKQRYVKNLRFVNMSGQLFGTFPQTLREYLTKPNAIGAKPKKPAEAPKLTLPP